MQSQVLEVSSSSVPALRRSRKKYFSLVPVLGPFHTENFYFEIPFRIKISSVKGALWSISIQ